MQQQISKALLYESFLKRENELEHIAAFFKQNLELLPKTLPKEALELGCGTGRLFPLYHNLEYTLTALEIDPDYFEYALDYANKFPNFINVIKSDLQELNFTNQFSCISCINGTLTYLIHADERFSALKRMFQALRPGGILFLDQPNYYSILQNYGLGAVLSQEAIVQGEKILRKISHSIDFTNSLWKHNERYLRGDLIFRQDSYMFAMVSGQELEFMLSQAGFIDITLQSSWSKHANSELSPARIILSAKKPV